MPKHEVSSEISMEKGFVINRLSDGLGYGEGLISYFNLPPAVCELVEQTIETNPNILVKVDTDNSGRQRDDDGCGDGRLAGLIVRAGEKLQQNWIRAKVFGGATAMAVAALVGLGKAKNKTLDSLFTESIAQLEEKSIDFGAHTADHVAAGREIIDSGCGAIDGAPEIIQATAKYTTEIEQTLGVFGFSSEEDSDVLTNYKTYANSAEARAPYRGRAVMEKIKAAGKVVKQLVGGHKEGWIIINNVAGHTVNQELIRQVSGDQAHVFAVDLWRIGDIADRLYGEASPESRQAVIAQLVYTLGTAAVLTKGDLPVYLIDKPSVN